MPKITINNKIVSQHAPVFIIAEAGVNHNGDVKIAKQLIDTAKKAGADAVKFQTYVTEELIRPDAPKAKYQNENIGEQTTQFEMLKELELSPEQTKELKNYCDRVGIIFLSTPYDFSSLALLESLNLPAYKLASIDIVTHPLIEAIAQLNKPLLLSTGMATEAEINDAVSVFKQTAKSADNLILMQAVTNYPAACAEQNLLVLKTLQKYSPLVGFSDHTQTLTAAGAAIALGAKVIERHITLDKKMPGPDHAASAGPQEFETLVKTIRETESTLGKMVKKPTKNERENIIGMRRSICAKKTIAQGAKINEENLVFKRPGDGLNPTNKNIQLIVGKTAKQTIKPNQNITLDMVH